MSLDLVHYYAAGVVHNHTVVVVVAGGSVAVAGVTAGLGKLVLAGKQITSSIRIHQECEGGIEKSVPSAIIFCHHSR